MTRRSETLAEADLRVVYGTNGKIEKLINQYGVVMLDLTADAAAITAGDAGVAASVTALRSALETTAFKKTTNSVAPVISIKTAGAAGVQVLTVSNPGTWSNTPLSYAYQWQVAGVNVGGQVAIDYATAVGDATKAVTCDVTATNAAGAADAHTGSNSITPAAP